MSVDTIRELEGAVWAHDLSQLATRYRVGAIVVPGLAVLVIVLLLVLSELGISIAPLLGAAGIAGVCNRPCSAKYRQGLAAWASILLANQIRVGDHDEDRRTPVIRP